MVGAKGFIGNHFIQYYRQLFPNAIGTHHFSSDTFYPLNLENPLHHFHSLPLEGYKFAILAGGISNPRKCEDSPESSYKINVENTLFLCELLLEKKITPILLSSGYVFDGEKGSYLEDDLYSPVNVYGSQKVDLEKEAMKRFGNDCLILRIAKVFGHTRGDETLIDEIVSSLVQGKAICAASDQVLSPISVTDLILAVHALQVNQCRGIYHIGGLESISRYELAIKIASHLNVDRTLVNEISLDQIQSGFKRPKKSDLISQKFSKHTNMKITSLEFSINEIISQYPVCPVEERSFQ